MEPTRESHLHVLEGARYDGGRPSPFLHRLQALNTAAENPYSEDMVCFRWLALLPASLRVLLTAHAATTLQECGNLAYFIFFAQQQQQIMPSKSASYATPHVNSVSNQCLTANLRAQDPPIQVCPGRRRGGLLGPQGGAFWNSSPATEGGSHTRLPVNQHTKGATPVSRPHQFLSPLHPVTSNFPRAAPS